MRQSKVNSLKSQLTFFTSNNKKIKKSFTEQCDHVFHRSEPDWPKHHLSWKKWFKITKSKKTKTTFLRKKNADKSFCRKKSIRCQIDELSMSSPPSRNSFRFCCLKLISFLLFLWLYYSVKREYTFVSPILRCRL